MNRTVVVEAGHAAGGFGINWKTLCWRVNRNAVTPPTLGTMLVLVVPTRMFECFGGEFRAGVGLVA